MTVSIHGTWKALYGELSLEEYQDRILPKIFLIPDVHEDIRKTFGVIEKLLVHGYFEYEFLDVAVTKSLQAFEMGLKLRYEQITSKKWNKHAALDQLLDYFQSRNYFEVTNQAFIEHIRKSRNAIIHPERYGFGGYSGLHWIDTTIDLINDIYEDRLLRLQRLETRKILSQQLVEIVKNGGVVRTRNRSEVIFQLDLVFVNNKSKPHIYTFAASQIFSDPDSTHDPILIEIPEDFFVLKNAELACFPGTPFEIKFQALSDEVDLNAYSEWKNNKDKQAFVACQIFNSHRIDDIFIAARKTFHSQQGLSQS